VGTGPGPGKKNKKKTRGYEDRNAESGAARIQKQAAHTRGEYQERSKGVNAEEAGERLKG